MSAIPVGLTSNLYGEKIRPNSAKRVASPSYIYLYIYLYIYMYVCMYVCM